MDKNVGLTNFSIIIKNIPTNLERYDVEYELKTKFSEFGTIKKVTVLMDKYEPTKIREIAFIDLFQRFDIVFYSEFVDSFNKYRKGIDPSSKECFIKKLEDFK